MIRFFKAPVATTTTTSEGDHCANEIGPRNPPTSNESNSKGRDRKFNQAMIEVVANDAVVVHSVILQTAIRISRLKPCNFFATFLQHYRPDFTKTIQKCLPNCRPSGPNR
uniref:Uncharacterized protein n=1 Tax=Panagrellus redivivus TaxID=6233 RepID=A0A7E4W826_PANRE